MFYILLKNQWVYKKIQQRFPKTSDYQREVLLSIQTTLIFAVIGITVAHPDLLRPYTFLYSEINSMGWGYFFFSFILMIFIHDTYFYWMHRLMHTRWGMKYIHVSHHKSTNPSPWAAFSFHPFEAVIEAGILLVFAFSFPVHSLALFLFMIFMTLYNVYGHLGWELYPKGFHKTTLGKWINTSVNHNLHHKRFSGNYGLYFLIWDRVMGTIREDYDETFEEVTNRQPDQMAINQ